LDQWQWPVRRAESAQLEAFRYPGISLIDCLTF